jgi:hypothetical protein
MNAYELDLGRESEIIDLFVVAADSAFSSCLACLSHVTIRDEGNLPDHDHLTN